MTNTLPTWDLSDLYTAPDAPEIEHDLGSADQLASHAEQYIKGKVATLDGDKLARAIERYEHIEETLGRIGSYAYLYYAENMADPERIRFFQNTSEHINDISRKMLFLTLEINQISDAEMAEKILSSRKLAKYKPWLRDIRTFRPYQLSQDLEELLHNKQVTGRQAWVRLFDETQAKLRFPFQGKTLTMTEIMDYQSSKNEEERKESAESVGKVLAEHSDTFTMITNVLAKDKAIEDKWRKLPYPISSRNISNFIEDEVVDALLEAVKSYYPKISHRYYKIKAKMMGKDKLDYWDRNAPLPEDSSDKIEWEDAVSLVLDAYESFSPRLRELGWKFFENPWIDVPPREGKDSGAFAHPTIPSAHPYLLLNYQGKVRDVMTLAHELGHGVHQLLSAKQGPLMADTPLTLAETASVFGEQLTFREILKQEEDDTKKKIIIAGKVEDMINTVIRQTAFCEFERLVHDERKQGEIPAERLGELWMQVQHESLGSSIRFQPEYSHYWSYIPHFIHSPFYVYSYAFGDCLVNALYAQYLDGIDGFEDKYFAMLEAGGTLHHKELLEPFGLDATDPEFWYKGLDIISGFIDELEG